MVKTDTHFHSEDSKEKEKEKTALKDLTVPESSSDRMKRSLKSFLNNFRIHKSPGQKPPFKANPKILFGILAVICVALIVLTSVSERFAAPFKTAASVMITPAQSGVNTIGRWISDRLDRFKTVEKLSAENEELQAKIDELTASNTTLRQHEEELNRLKALLELKESYTQYETTGAQIVSKDSSKWFSTFTINKGSLDGMKLHMNVIAGGGLVGVIVDVGLNYSIVRSIIDDQSNISAMFEKSSDLCYVSGNMLLMDSNLLEFSDVRLDVDIGKNDAVVTSNVSSIFLPGLLIGYVNDWQIDGNELTKSGHLVPVVDFTSLSEVLVITQLKETSD